MTFTADISNMSIQNTSLDSKFDASKLGKNELDQLYQIARRQDRTELREKLEEEVFRREQEKVEKADQILR